MANGDKLMIMYEDDEKSIFDVLKEMSVRLLEAPLGWYDEIVQARATARDITDNKGIPALDKINNDLLVATIKNEELLV
jgi:hypothetical protein